MIALRSFVQAALVAACAAGALVSLQVYLSSETGPAPQVVRVLKPQTLPRVDVIALRRAQESDFEASRRLSPVYPTVKYTTAQLTPTAITNPIKTKRVAARSARTLPLQIAYVPTAASAYTR